MKKTIKKGKEKGKEIKWDPFNEMGDDLSKMWNKTKFKATGYNLINYFNCPHCNKSEIKWKCLRGLGSTCIYYCDNCDCFISASPAAGLLGGGGKLDALKEKASKKMKEITFTATKGETNFMNKLRCQKCKKKSISWTSSRGFGATCFYYCHNKKCRSFIGSGPTMGVGNIGNLVTFGLLI